MKAKVKIEYLSDLITEEEARKRGLVYTGIAIVGSMTKKDKNEIIEEAAKEWDKTHIPCYPVIKEGYGGSGLYVYADPLYSKLQDYYRHTNFADNAYRDFVKANEVLSEAIGRYREHLETSQKLQKELYDKGVRY